MPKAEVIKPARFRWSLNRQISQFENEAKLKEQIAEKLRAWNADYRWGPSGEHYTATQALKHKFTKGYFSWKDIVNRKHWMGSDTLFKPNLAPSWNQANSIKAGRIALFPIPVAFQLLTMVAVAPFSAYRALKRDPEIFAKRIVGNIWLSKGDEETKSNRLKEIIDGLQNDAQKRRKIAAQLKIIYEGRYAKGEAGKKRSEIENEVKQMESMLEWIGQKEDDLKAGKIRTVPDNLPHLILYNEHLWKLPELTQEKREEKIDGLKQLLNAMIEVKKSSLEYQLRKFEAQYGNGEEDRKLQQGQGN
ncbi:hypothetical protein J4220_02610 [Candidatus Micrarchaeota archaeon]|nr:hypothetical protein [Candidatus Micrarchaeota archaeon]